MKIKIITTSMFALILIVGTIMHLFFSNSFVTIEKQYASIIVEGEVQYPYHLPIKKGTFLRDAMFEFGVTPSSDLDDLYIKVSYSWVEIGGDHVIEEDARFKVGKK